MSHEVEPATLGERGHRARRRIEGHPSRSGKIGELDRAPVAHEQAEGDLAEHARRIYRR